MDIFYVEINNIKIKSFSTFELAFNFIKTFEESDDTIYIYHEEFVDEFHGSETSTRLYLVYTSKPLK